MWPIGYKKKAETEAATTPKASSKKEKPVAKETKETKVSKKVEKSPVVEESKTKKPANKFYAAYMRREGPKNPGSKPVPIGKPNCFAGLKFLQTGVLDSMDREECKSIIEKYGGSCISGVTKKLDYLIVGEDGGQSKIEKATELNIKQINEDEFLQLICTKSGIKNPTYESGVDVEMQPNEEKENQTKELSESIDFLDSKKKVKEEARVEELSESIDFIDEKVDKKLHVTSSDSAPIQAKKIKTEPVAEKPVMKYEPREVVEPTLLWVDKYKPLKMNKIIGQTTEKSNAPKLFNWLKNWQKFHGSQEGKTAKKSWNDQDTGSTFKAALLSGPPGIGKTTTAQLVCQEAGYTYIEFNASDARSKKLLDKVLGESVESCSIDSYFKSKHKVSDVASDKHCIIMDEVDGMAGNEDRGGILELINTIKHSKIPVICICNDRQHVKIRSLANHCFDLRFYKPRIEQVRAALMSVCFKENIKITPELIDQIIIGCNYDIRQCLHNLSMWSSNNKVMSSSTSTKSDIEKSMKDTKMNPFEACKQVFQRDPAKPSSMIDKMDLFFTDYSLIPLLVAENYLTVKPNNLTGNTKQQKDRCHLQLLAEASEAICQSDRISRQIRTNNNWSLLTTQAVFATVIPGEKLQGSIGLPAFPGWFGKNSKQNRVDRILQELQKHMRIHISANKIGVGLDYLSVLKRMLSKPLISSGLEGVDQVIAVMNQYCLTRDDFDTILELATWPGQKDPMSLIDSKVKASFTRTFNKQAHMNPFTVVDIKKLKAVKAGDEMGEDEEELIESDEDDDKKDDVTKDAMIKVNTKKKSATTTAAKASTSVKRSAKAVDGDAKPSASKKKKT